jgi:hypothetical protein
MPRSTQRKKRGGFIRTTSRPRSNSWRAIEADTLVGQLAAEIDDVYPEQAWDIKQRLRSFLLNHFLAGAPIQENNEYFEQELETVTGLPNVDVGVRNRVWAVYKKLTEFDGNMLADAVADHLEPPSWIQNGGKKKKRNSRKNSRSRRTRRSRK